MKSIQNLLKVKSIVTLSLTAAFAALSLRGTIGGQEYLTVFSVVIAFYFGTQTRGSGAASAGGEG